MPRQTIDMTDYATLIMGNKSSDVSTSIEMAARVMASEIKALEEIFTLKEWRVLAHVLKDRSFPADRSPRSRIVFELEDAQENSSLLSDYQVVVSQFMAVLSNLSDAQHWALITTLQFAHTHCPTRIDRDEWWTLAYRRNAMQPTEGMRRRRGGNREEKPTQKTSDSPSVTSGNGTTPKPKENQPVTGIAQ